MSIFGSATFYHEKLYVHITLAYVWFKNLHCAKLYRSEPNRMYLKFTRKENKKKKFNKLFFSFTVSQLRGHWEDTSGKVQSRKNTLEELVTDNRQFEVKQQEIEAWLGKDKYFSNFR